jgi:hypothetical protein
LIRGISSLRTGSEVTLFVIDRSAHDQCLVVAQLHGGLLFQRADLRITGAIDGQISVVAETCG